MYIYIDMVYTYNADFYRQAYTHTNAHTQNTDTHSHACTHMCAYTRIYIHATYVTIQLCLHTYTYQCHMHRMHMNGNVTHFLAIVPLTSNCFHASNVHPFAPLCCTLNGAWPWHPRIANATSQLALSASFAGVCQDGPLIHGCCWRRTILARGLGCGAALLWMAGGVLAATLVLLLGLKEGCVC